MGIGQGFVATSKREWLGGWEEKHWVETYSADDEFNELILTSEM